MSLPIAFSCNDFDSPVDEFHCDAITNKITGIIAGGWILAFVINLAASEASPAMVAKFECPPSSAIKSEYVRLSYNQPSEKTYTFQCLDQKAPKKVSPKSQWSAIAPLLKERGVFFTHDVKLKSGVHNVLVLPSLNRID